MRGPRRYGGYVTLLWLEIQADRRLDPVTDDHYENVLEPPPAGDDAEPRGRLGEAVRWGIRLFGVVVRRGRSQRGGNVGVGEQALIHQQLDEGGEHAHGHPDDDPDLFAAPGEVD